MGHADDRRFVVGTAAGLAVWNNVVHLAPPAATFYVPLNLSFAGVLLWAARRRGLSWRRLGLAPDRVPAGLRWGGAVAAVVAAGVTVAVAVPRLRPLLDDARVRQLDLGGVAYQAFVRVPLGTVVLEEVAFRGVLYGAWHRLAGRVPAVLGSSAVFGLWHVRPTLGLLDANDVAGGVAGRAAGAGAGVVLTGAGGALLCLLRIRSGSAVAPAAAHAAANSLGVLAAAVAQRLAP